MEVYVLLTKDGKLYEEEVAMDGGYRLTVSLCFSTSPSAERYLDSIQFGIAKDLKVQGFHKCQEASREFK
jgi:hypothetical protein